MINSHSLHGGLLLNLNLKLMFTSNLINFDVEIIRQIAIPRAITSFAQVTFHNLIHDVVHAKNQRLRDMFSARLSVIISGYRK